MNPKDTIPTWRDNCGRSTNLTNGKNIAISPRPRLQDSRTLWETLIQEYLDYKAFFAVKVNYEDVSKADLNGGLLI